MDKIEAAADVPVKKNDFSGIAYSGGTIRQIWADCPLVIDLQGLRILPQVPLLYNHP